MNRGESGQATVEYALIACAIIVFMIGMKALLAHTYQAYILHGIAFRLSYQLPRQYKHNIQCLGDSPEASLDKVNARLRRKLVAFQDLRPRQCPYGHWVFTPGSCAWREEIDDPACGGEVVPLLEGANAKVSIVSNGELHIEIFALQDSLCQGFWGEIFNLKRDYHIMKRYIIPDVDCR